MDEKRKKFGGRKPGSKNLVQRNVKALIEKAFVQSGGMPEFLRWIEANRGEFYTKMVAKLIPRQLEAKVEETSGHQVVIYIPDNGRGDSQEPVACLPAEREAG